MVFDESTLNRFWSKVSKGGPDECWDWTGAGCDSQNKYGRILAGGRIWHAHRLSFSIANGDIPKGMCVCHSCDRYQCVNPKHLWLGSHADNMSDMKNKGRSLKGESHHEAVLLDSQVGYIKRLIEAGYSDSTIAGWYCIHRMQIGRIRRGNNWRHIEPAVLHPFHAV